MSKQIEMKLLKKAHIPIVHVRTYIDYRCDDSREEVEKQEATRRYQALHAEGKTEEARADLARLALIRKQREDAAKKKEQEKIG